LDTNELEKLAQLTKQLLKLNEEALNRYQTLPEDYIPDFYKDIKPFSDRIYERAAEWKTLALQWIQNEKIRYLYPNQIENTFENLQTVSIQAFQKKSYAAHFYSMIKSNDYILQTMLHYLEKQSNR